MSSLKPYLSTNLILFHNNTSFVPIVSDLYQNSNILAALAGFEPADPGVKVLCLTTWRKGYSNNLCSAYENMPLPITT